MVVDEVIAHLKLKRQDEEFFPLLNNQSFVKALHVFGTSLAETLVQKGSWKPGEDELLGGGAGAKGKGGSGMGMPMMFGGAKGGVSKNVMATATGIGNMPSMPGKGTRAVHKA